MAALPSPLPVRTRYLCSKGRPLVQSFWNAMRWQQNGTSFSSCFIALLSIVSRRNCWPYHYVLSPVPVRSVKTNTCVTISTCIVKA